MGGNFAESSEPQRDGVRIDEAQNLQYDDPSALIPRAIRRPRNAIAEVRLDREAPYAIARLPRLVPSSSGRRIW